MRCLTVLIVASLAAALLASCSSEDIESVAVSGTAPCVKIEPVGAESSRYECEESLDDERVSGTSLVGVTKVDFSVTPTDLAGTFWLENDGGSWEGDWTGVIEPDGLHIIEGTMVGSGGYKGLVYRATWEYYDWPATVSGTIEPAA